jgi:cation:H+ antiporter
VELLLPSLAILGGFIALVWGADRFVEGSAATARNLGVSPLIIGLTIVAFGTSAPEMLVSSFAAWAGNGGIAVGNAIGSNITNVALVLGVSSIIAPLSVHSKILSRELPLLVLTMLLALGLILDGDLGRIDGVILLSGLLVLVGWMVGEGMRERKDGEQEDALSEEFAEEIPEGMSMGKAIFWLVVGLLVLLGSARLVVYGASEVARHFGVSDLVIGLTVVALGTSLPELAASVVSAMKNEHDIAIGNVVGSNMFNLLGVLAFPGLIRPGEVGPAVLTRDFPVMLGVTILLWLKARGFYKKSELTRFNGATLVLIYVGYVAWLFIDTLN